LTTRAKTDPFGESLYTPEVDFAVVDRARRRGCDSARRVERPDRARLAVAQARRDGADRGATKAQHLEEAIAAEELSLSAAEIERLEEPYVPHAVSGH